MLKRVYQEAMAGISLFTIIQISSHVVDELYKLSFARSKIAKAVSTDLIILIEITKIEI